MSLWRERKEAAAYGVLVNLAVSYQNNRNPVVCKTRHTTRFCILYVLVAALFSMRTEKKGEIPCEGKRGNGPHLESSLATLGNGKTLRWLELYDGKNLVGERECVRNTREFRRPSFLSKKANIRFSFFFL